MLFLHNCCCYASIHAGVRPPKMTQRCCAVHLDRVVTFDAVDADLFCTECETYPLMTQLMTMT